MTSKEDSARLQRDSLLKILKLEESKGFNNTAVIGGMDRFLQRLASDFAAISNPALLTVPYGAMGHSERKEWVGHAVAALESPSPESGSLADAGAQQPAGHTADTPGDPLPGLRAVDAPAPPLPAPSPLPPMKRIPVPAGVTVDSPVDRLRGVDTKISARLRKLGVSTIRELLYLFPRHHNDFSRVSKISGLVPGDDQTIVGTVWEAREVSLGRRLKATEAIVSDDSGTIKVVWFGRAYLVKALKPGATVTISGRADVYKGQIQFESPEFEILDGQENLLHTGRLVPVYPLTEGLTARRLRTILWQALERWVPLIEEFLPEDIISRVGLLPLPRAIMQAHYPDDPSSVEMARRRLAFDEFFLIQLAMLSRRKSWNEGAEGVAIQPESAVLDSFRASLPFSLTDAQDRCLGEVLADMAAGTPPMNRLLQGEVGSGKTVVALTALLGAVTSGYQGSIMVPTEVLAEQHFDTVSRLLGHLAGPVEGKNLITVNLDPHSKPISVGLLTGSTRGSSKKELLQRAAEGNLDIVIGTHALIQEGVEIPRLALAVVDEQHRFGVEQRAALRQRGSSVPHVLVMSATPIPRTLALTLYGDLDISTIDQLPPGRRHVVTRQLPPERRSAAYDFIRRQISDGRQAFVVCPLIDESEAVEARAAVVEYERLSTEVFPDLRLGLLHGRMAARDKDQVMRKFRDGETDILVSTPVVEVGIDVPNASVMVVEGAHRFGLSQLHQFRGRVGRGEHKSYCLLLSDYSTAEASERLSALERIHDGFQLAEVDLELRGPGDFFGTRQSGLPSLRMARLSDQELLRLAREEATRFAQEAPLLEDSSQGPLVREVSRFLERVRGEIS